jgi:hypothetical protein
MGEGVHVSFANICSTGLGSASSHQAIRRRPMILGSKLGAETVSASLLRPQSGTTNPRLLRPLGGSVRVALKMRARGTSNSR